MGMFSYSCTKCGDKSQFDWSNCCVVKIGDVFVRGHYDMYGGVKIRLETDGKKEKEDTILAYPEQFRQFFDCWDRSSGALLATDIYCDGDGTQDPFSLLCQRRGQDRMVMLLGNSTGGRNSGSEDAPNRHCAPRDIAILDTLSSAMLEDLPKVVPATAIGKKEAKDDTAAPPKAKKTKVVNKGTADDSSAPKAKKTKSAEF